MKLDGVVRSGNDLGTVSIKPVKDEAGTGTIGTDALIEAGTFKSVTASQFDGTLNIFNNGGTINIKGVRGVAGTGGVGPEATITVGGDGKGLSTSGGIFAGTATFGGDLAKLDVKPTGTWRTAVRWWTRRSWWAGSSRAPRSPRT